MSESTTLGTVAGEPVTVEAVLRWRKIEDAAWRILRHVDGSTRADRAYEALRSALGAKP